MAGPMFGEESSSLRQKAAAERRRNRRKLYENGAAIPALERGNSESSFCKNATTPSSHGENNQTAGQRHSSPQEHFTKLLQGRGYSIPLVETLDSDYCTSISEEQLASYGPYMLKVVRSGDATALYNALSCGLSPNGCNKYGESLLHLVCRRGRHELLEIMINHGVNLQVGDDYGRCPLHDAFWASTPAFDVVNTLLKIDYTMLFMQDRRGHLPLTYVHVEDWNVWKEWINEMADEYFPAGSNGTTPVMKPACRCSPNQNFQGLLSVELIKMVANGKLSPFEASAMAQYQNDDEDGEEDDDTQLGTECAYFGSEHGSLYTEDEDSDIDDEDDSSYCEMENEVEILEILKVAMASNQRGRKLDSLVSESDNTSLFLFNSTPMAPNILLAGQEAPGKVQQQTPILEEEEEDDCDDETDHDQRQDCSFVLEKGPSDHVDEKPEDDDDDDEQDDKLLFADLKKMMEQDDEEYGSDTEHEFMDRLAQLVDDE